MIVLDLAPPPKNNKKKQTKTKHLRKIQLLCQLSYCIFVVLSALWAYACAYQYLRVTVCVPQLCLVQCCEYEIGQLASALQPSRPGPRTVPTAQCSWSAWRNTPALNMFVFLYQCIEQTKDYAHSTCVCSCVGSFPCLLSLTFFFLIL